MHDDSSTASTATSAEVQAPARYAERLGRNPVWHCPLRTGPGDRVLSDAEWAQVAEDLMDRTGIAPRGDDGGCRWIAVRHDAESIHVVAVLARQDGGRAHPDNDRHQIRRTCLPAEQQFGLHVTAPADKTAARHTTRAEVEQAARRGLSRPARDWLRQQVQYAAAGARDPVAFLDQLCLAGVEVRERHDETGQLIGYAVGRREPGRETVLFGGGKLAADLSLPKLRTRVRFSSPLRHRDLRFHRSGPSLPCFRDLDLGTAVGPESPLRAPRRGMPGARPG